MNNIKNILLLFFICVLLSWCTNSVKPSNDSPSDSAVNLLNSPPSDNTIERDISHTHERDISDTHHRNLVTNTCTPNPNSSILNMTVIPQEEDLWCWAACGEMVMEKLRGNIMQCDEANRRFGRSDCCPPRGRPRPSACNNTGWPQFDKYNLKADTTFCQALSWEEIKKQIDCKKKPFCWTLRWTDDTSECGDINSGTDTSGHMMVISGYKRENGDSLVKVLDPDPKGTGNTFWISYSRYVCGPGYGHWNNFYNIRKK